MHLRSAVSSVSITELVSRINLPRKSTEGYVATKTLRHRLDDYLMGTEVDGAFAHRQVTHDVDGVYPHFYDWGEGVTADNANNYKYNFGVQFDPGNGAVLQLRPNWDNAGQHLRLTIKSFEDDQIGKMRDFCDALRGAIDRPIFIPANWASIEKMSVVVQISGLALDDLSVNHRSNSAGHSQQIVHCLPSNQKYPWRTENEVCGYQFGKALRKNEILVAATDETSLTDNPTGWEQNRTIALRNEAFSAGELPCVGISFVLREATTLIELREFNPLAGLELLQYTSRKQWIPVPTWNPQSVWNEVLGNLNVIVGPTG